MFFNMIHIDSFKFRISLILSRTSRSTNTAACAVFSRNLQDKFLTCKFFTFVISAFQSSRSGSEFCVRSHFHTNNAVRANDRAFTALDTSFRIPNRNFGSDTTFFILCRTGRPCTVNNGFKSRNRKLFTATCDNFAGNFLNKFRRISRNRKIRMQRRSRLSRNFNFMHMSQRSVNSGKVLLNNGIALLRISFLNSVFNFSNSLFAR